MDVRVELVLEAVQMLTMLIELILMCFGAVLRIPAQDQSSIYNVLAKAVQAVLGFLDKL